MRLPDIPYLLCKTLAELVLLPFHVAWFLVRRGAIRREIREVLTDSARARAGRRGP
jgi:hypothetical protein